MKNIFYKVFFNCKLLCRLYRSLFTGTAEDMLLQDEHLTCVSCRVNIIGKVYY